MNSKIIFVSSHTSSILSFLLPHIRVLSSEFSLQIFANTRDRTILQSRGVNIPVDFVPVERRISIWFDIKALIILFLRFKRVQPAAVHSITPKAGLLTMVAAWLAGVPVRTHSFTGQVWANKVGLKRRFFKFFDKLIAMFATDCLVDSPSQRRFLIKEGVVGQLKCNVLGYGSICGVDTKRFSPDQKVRSKLRSEMAVSDESFICLYLGRLNKDKGVLDLAVAFSRFALSRPNVELWLVGPDEESIFNQILDLTGPVAAQVCRVGYTSEPEHFMRAADLFCLPSYREGFGSSVIEAAACGLPSLVSRIYGLTDAVIEGETGWMHEPGNVDDILDKLEMITLDPGEMRARGLAARVYVESKFEEGFITSAMKKFYESKFGH